MSAGDIEGLTDQIVEHMPGDRDLAERIARGIWPYIERRERFAVHEFHREPTEFAFVRLTDGDLDGATGRRERAADRPQGPLRANQGAMRGHGDGTSEGEKR